METGLIINSYVFDMTDFFDEKEKAAFWDTLTAYSRGDPIPEMTKPVIMAFRRVADDNKKFDPEHKKELSEMRSQIGKKGAEARWHTDGKQWQTMANDGKTSLVMANTANPHKEKNIDKDKEKNIEKTSVSEERGGEGEGETAILTEDKLARRKEIFMQKGGTAEDFYTYAVNHGWTKESPQT